MRQTQNRNRKHQGKGTSQHFNGSNVQGLTAYPNPLQAGAPKLPWRRGWGLDTLPPGPNLCSTKRPKAFESSPKIISKLFRSVFSQSILRSPEVTEGQIQRNNIFLQLCVIISETIIGRRPQKRQPLRCSFANTSSELTSP